VAEVRPAVDGIRVCGVGWSSLMVR